jgi:hypothetical protein
MGVIFASTAAPQVPLFLGPAISRRSCALFCSLEISNCRAFHRFHHFWQKHPGGVSLKSRDTASDAGLTQPFRLHKSIKMQLVL